MKNRYIRESNVRHVTLRVFNTDGSRCTVNAPVTLTGIDVKTRALAEFRSIQRIVDCSRQTDCDIRPNCNKQELEQLSKMHRITRISNIHERFDETSSLVTANFQNYEELLLIHSADYCNAASNVESSPETRNEAGTVSRNRFSNDRLSDIIGDFIHNTNYGVNQSILPTHEEIEIATRYLDATESTTKNNLINVYEFVPQHDVQHDIRRILISLSNSCAFVIGAGPYSNRTLHMLKQKLIQQKRSEYDTQQYLVDMGFTQRNVQHALHMCKLV